MAILRVGSVGLGGISGGVHIPGIERSPDLALAAVCDIDPARLKERGDRYGIPENRRFTDYRDLIACPEVSSPRRKVLRRRKAHDHGHRRSRRTRPRDP